MNDHNLDDLIIGDPGYGSKNSKGLLTIIALVIVIVIVGMILWALIFGSDNSAPLAEPDTPTATQSRPLDPSLVPLDAKPTHTPKSEPTPKPAPAPKPVTPKPEPTPAPQAKPAPKPAAPQPVVKPSTPPPAAKPEPATEPAAKPAKDTELIQNANKTIYYIQVGAFKRDPNPKFIQKLKENGFTFITKKTGDMRRVRVGPYDSYDEAKAALPTIKEKLGIDGLIVKY
jgi:outer membrane biosynthesis protein TonB